MRRFLVFVLGALVLLADQLTKSWAVHRLDHGLGITVVPNFIQLTLTTNTGAAFGMFQSSTAILGFIALAAGIGIAVYVIRHKAALPAYQAVALGLTLGGACGNFSDRFRLHYVVDFIYVHVGTHQWPVFNLADSAICIGVVMLAVRYAAHPGATDKHTQPPDTFANPALSGGPVEPSTGSTE